MQKATQENENEKAKQFQSMAQETVGALASSVSSAPAKDRQDDEIYSLASKMIMDTGDKTQQSQEVGQPAGEDNTLVANKEGSNLQMVQVSIPVSKPTVLYEKKEQPEQVAAVQTTESVTRADDFDDSKDSKLAQLTEMADQANSADAFADAGSDNDDDEDDEEDEPPAADSHVQTKAVTDADNFKVFKYRLEHEPQNVANQI